MNDLILDASILTKASLEEIIWFFLDATVLIMTLIYKMPQVYTVVNTRSSAGISMSSLGFEFVSYSVEMTYQAAMMYPFRTYYEICFMWAQDVVLVYVVLEDRKLINSRLILPFLLYCLGFVSIAARWLPDSVMFALIMSTTPGLIISKSAQLWKIIRNRDPGVVSVLTWGMLVYMAAVRVLTTSLITKDIPMFLNNLSATILNAAIVIAILYYRSCGRRRSQ